MIRVRFAPSPTGFLHIGGVRTALFNFLYARNQGGKFLLRIEDTDRERSRPEFEEEILTSLRWLGLDWDEAVIRQSGQLDRYRQAAEALVGRGLAYEETLDGKKGVKFRLPARNVVFTDLVHGPVEFDTSLFGDLVILKSDGFPTYQLACVVDDHEMGITHVIRGDDHLSNTPRQLLLFEAMGWTPPKYGHLPLILGSDGTPLSKRHGAVACTSYRGEGFLPEGLLNYLALLGWAGDGNQEFYTLKDLVKKFSVKRINKTNARFDPEKLAWLNAQHLKALPEAEYLSLVSGYYKDLRARFQEDRWRRLALLYRPRIKILADLAREAAYCFGEPEAYDPATLGSFFKDPALAGHLGAWLKQAEGLGDFEDIARLDGMTRELAGARGIEARALIHPLRFALTAKTGSPGLFELMAVLGKTVCLKRLAQFLDQGRR